MSSQDTNEKKYNCQCGEAFSSVEELNEHNHKAHWLINSSNLTYFLLQLLNNLSQILINNIEYMLVH